MDVPDKTHADWLLTSQECLVKSIDASLSTELITNGNEKLLVIKRIPADKLVQMKFITNTDQNNNYMYLSDLAMYTDTNSLAPLNTNVIEPILIKMFAAADAEAFINTKITHSPFLPRMFAPSNGARGALVPFVRYMSILLPKTLCPDLRKRSLFFDIVLKIHE